MRKLLAVALLVAMAWPAGAFEAPIQDGAADLLQALRADREVLATTSGRSARRAAGLLKKGERTLGKLVARFETDDAFDSAKFALVAKSGRWVARAVETGALDPSAASMTEWSQLFGRALAASDDVVEDAVVECDHVVISTYRAKVAKKLDAAILALARAAEAGGPADHAREAARALQAVEKAVARARKFCAREAKVNAPQGIRAFADRIECARRDGLLIRDLSWDLTISTAEGGFMNRTTGRLSAPELSHLELIPIPVARRESVSAFELANINGIVGRRVDGVVIWTTNRGTIHVPVHTSP